MKAATTQHFGSPDVATVTRVLTPLPRAGTFIEVLANTVGSADHRAPSQDPALDSGCDQAPLCPDGTANRRATATLES
jgi:hypothetical protein